MIRFPDPRLKAVCRPISAAEAAPVIADLVDTMRANRGCVGLAAPQIGENVRVAVVDVSSHRLTTAAHGLLLLVNPVVEAGVGSHIAREGCLSLPDITADVARAVDVLVTVSPGQTLWSTGFEARALQHEIDHLDGLLILDRVAGSHALHPRRTY